MTLLEYRSRKITLSSFYAHDSSSTICAKQFVVCKKLRVQGNDDYFVDFEKFIE